MHNLSNEYFQNEYQTGANEYGNALSPEFEFNNENEYIGESAYELSPEFEYGNQEMGMYQGELSQELMEINTEAEFGAWLKKLGKKAAGVTSDFLNSSLGQQATAALGNIASKTLTNLGSKAGAWAGGKIGGVFGKSDYGRQLGQQVGSAGGQAVANRYPSFVRFATDALSSLSQEVETGGTPAIKPAIIKAARKHYPFILIKVSQYGSTKGNRKSRGPEMNEYNETAYESEGEISNEGTFNEVTEMELASELLSIQSEAELDHFFGGVFKKIKNFASSGTGRALGSMLKGLAKKALPIAGGALGSFIAPGIGTAIGSQLGGFASNLFELELEGLSAEDREFETARAFVRFAGNAAHRASRMRNQPPVRAARNAIVGAARTYAPGLLVRDHRSTTIDDNSNNAQTGSWHRDGNRIILNEI